MPKAQFKQDGLLDTWGRKNRKLLDKKCPQCSRLFKPRSAKSIYCSRPCMWKNNGGHNKKTETWWKNSKGYIEGRVWIDDNTQIRVKQHRYIMERHLGRKLLPDEDIHHINGVKDDNRITNLQVLNHSDHTTLTNNDRWSKERGES